MRMFSLLNLLIVKHCYAWTGCKGNPREGKPPFTKNANMIDRHSFCYNWRGTIRPRPHLGTRNVVLWARLVFLRFGIYYKVKISFQHGLVGFRLSFGLVYLRTVRSNVTGVYSMATLTLGNQLNSQFFNILGTVT